MENKLNEGTLNTTKEVLKTVARNIASRNILKSIYKENDFVEWNEKGEGIKTKIQSETEIQIRVVKEVVQELLTCGCCIYLPNSISDTLNLKDVV